MVDLDKEENLTKAMLKSAFVFLKLLPITFFIVWLILFALNGFNATEAFTTVINQIDLMLVVFCIGFLCDIPYRIYYVRKANKQNR